MPSSSTRVSTLLADLAAALGEVGARWYLFGAQASIVHGATRLTADVDLTKDLDDVETLLVARRDGLDHDVIRETSSEAL